MLTGQCGGDLMLGYQKSAAAALPCQPPSVENRMIQSTSRSRVNLEQAFVLITQQVLLHFTHGVAWQLGEHEALLRNFEVRQL